MTTKQETVTTELIELVTELAGDWEYDGEITLETKFLGDLEVESLDLVVIGAEMQERYGKLPFSEFLADVGERPVEERDVTVAEFVDFICRNSELLGEAA